jgi:hypothetical protein
MHRCSLKTSENLIWFSVQGGRLIYRFPLVVFTLPPNHHAALEGVLILRYLLIKPIPPHLAEAEAQGRPSWGSR